MLKHIAAGILRKGLIEMVATMLSYVNLSPYFILMVLILFFFQPLGHTTCNSLFKLSYYLFSLSRLSADVISLERHLSPPRTDLAFPPYVFT